MIICCMMQLYIIIKILLIVSSWIGCENNINHIRGNWSKYFFKMMALSEYPIVGINFDET